MTPVESENPYEPPQAEIFSPGEGFEVPGTFGGKLVLAFRLFFGNLPQIAAVVLTVWLPANMAITSILSSPAASRDPEKLSFQLNNVTEAIFGPLVAGGIIGLLAERLVGRTPSYGTIMGVGFRNWGRLFGARFFSGLRILIGLIALIIPGIVLAVRYSLIDPVVILEPERRISAWARSGELVKGKWWEILAVHVLFFGGLIGVTMVLNAAYEEIAAFQNFWGAVVIGCVQSILGAFSTVLMFLYYVDGRNRESCPPTEVIKPVRFSEIDL